MGLSDCMVELKVSDYKTIQEFISYEVSLYEDLLSSYESSLKRGYDRPPFGKPIEERRKVDMIGKMNCEGRIKSLKGICYLADAYILLKNNVAESLFSYGNGQEEPGWGVDESISRKKYMIYQIFLCEIDCEIAIKNN